MKEHSLSILLDQKPIQILFDIFEGGSKEIRIVGGSVRDALIGKITRDIDVAANASPNEIIKILKKNDLSYEDYAYKYGSITACIENQKFQITTLREDTNQIGRHTNIIFTQDWEKDAARRDFTINAMYLSRNGKIKDFFNGQDDLANNTLRFIGNIEKRIKEDFLRVFRYYRFLSIFEKPRIIDGYESILLNYFERSFNFLSNDLIRQEILKIFNLSFPLNSFFCDNKDMKKRYWVELTKKHFVKTGYELGLTRCLNRIDLLIK